jgi:hypothetical protein
VKHEQGINKIAGRAAGILLLKTSRRMSTAILELDNIFECLRGFIQLLFFLPLRGLHETAASCASLKAIRQLPSFDRFVFEMSVLERPIVSVRFF